MELRTGRQSMAARVIQMERKQDTMSAKVHETSKEIKQILAKISAPEEQIPSAEEQPPSLKKDSKYVTSKELKKFGSKVERLLERALVTFGTELNGRFERIERGIGNLGGQLSTSDDSSLEMEVDQFEPMEDDEEDSDNGSSANSAKSDNNNVTATGQSPTKKLKGDQGSDKK